MLNIECISLSDSNLSGANILCLGNFDGVHLAHRALLQSAKQLCINTESDVSCGVLCFREPSSDFLISPPPAHLCTLQQKIERFRDEGMDFVFLMDFPQIQNMSAESFVKNVLNDVCNAVGAVCGFNYRFGKNGTGDPKLLKKLLNGPVHVCGEVKQSGKTVSSTYIRHLLTGGQVEEAAALLTVPYCFTAPVQHGKQLGRKIGIPTINQTVPPKMQIPAKGVYVTDCLIDGTVYRGVTNVGVHPTVDKEATINCETYLLDFTDDIYEKEVRVSFLKFLRKEQKFLNLEALCAQIERDIAVAKAF